jgi:hypothetical protein
VPVEIRGLRLGAGYIGHAHDWAVGWTRVWGEPRGLEVVGSDIRCEKKSRGSLKGERGIVTRRLSGRK